MMTKDKEGNPIFKVGKSYKMREFVNPVWVPGTASECTETKDRVEGEKVVANGMGLFTLGDDTRWWAATNQFDEV